MYRTQPNDSGFNHIETEKKNIVEVLQKRPLEKTSVKKLLFSFCSYEVFTKCFWQKDLVKQT
jgi:hypothetical protein